MIGNAIAGLFGVGVAPSTSAYESIATVTVGGGGASDVTFTSIPSTFKHLQIRYLCQTNRSGSAIDSVLYQFNGDTASNYWWHNLYSPGGTIVAGDAGGAATRIIPVVNATATTTAGANVFGVGVIDILDYTNSKYKTLRGLAGSNSNTPSGNIGFGSGLWSNTSAITSIRIAMVQGTLFSQYSSFALYGIKG